MDNVPSCYLALGALHSLFKAGSRQVQGPSRFPRTTATSRCTTLIGPYGSPVEVQIRTVEMHQVAQDGVAAHWLWPRIARMVAATCTSGRTNGCSRFSKCKATIPPSSSRTSRSTSFPTTFTRIHAQGQDHGHADARGDGDRFRHNGTTYVGHHCSAARVNQDLVPLRTELRNGDMVEIITRRRPVPNWCG